MRSQSPSTGDHHENDYLERLVQLGPAADGARHVADYLL